MGYIDWNFYIKKNIKMKSNLDKTDKKKIGVYIIQNPTTMETYVGSGILGNRESEHKVRLEKGIHGNYKLQKAYNKNPNFDFIAIPVDEPDLTPEQNRELALALEQQNINEFKDSDLLLNIAEDAVAPMFGKKMSDTARNDLKNRMIKQWSDPLFKEKMCLKLKESAKNNPRTPEITAKIISKTTGQKRSDEFREQARISGIERMKNPDIRNKISTTLTGYKHNQIARENMSNSAKKYSQTKEGINKLQLMNQKCVEARSVSIKTPSGFFNSIAEASIALNIPTSTIFNRIISTSNTFKDWTYNE